MNFKPILFSTPMVRAILEGRKTMTRRMTGLDKLNENPSNWQKVTPDVYTISNEEDNDPWSYCDFQTLSGEYMACPRFPYGQVGDVLWVRETFCWDLDNEDEFLYRASHPEAQGLDGESPWRPSIHMPKAACRIFLEITDIRVERLQDIDSYDYEKEGFRPHPQSAKSMTTAGIDHRHYMKAATEWWKNLWTEINGIESWEANPWVWVVSFKRTERPETFLQSLPKTV